ncbi:MAG: biopolymer transporter ExbD [Kiritimatiellia bacterium]|nr:biopolymer transporter ExbD [Kiritimatiellia bacterium]
MRRTSIVALNQIREINLTPLIDLTFILLITFIITFPLIEQGIPVDLPRGKAQDLKDRQSRSITVDKAGVVFLDLRPVTLTELEKEMTELAASDPEAVVMVRGDQSLVYGKMVEVLRLLQRAKIARMALVTQAEE